MNELPKSWAALVLGESVVNIAITEKKIPQKKYLSAGAYPIFDQGQDYIGGYTDKKEKLVECELPIIIFGDHTRVVKFVNQPFAPGADGVKVLQPRSFYNPKLLEYFTQHIATHLTSHGYARHYQHLVKSTIPLPPLNEQHRIVAKIEELFSELDKGIEYLKTAQAQLKVYRQALLKHAFEGKLTAQWRAQRRAKQSVAPAQAGAQPLNDMDSHPTPSRGQALHGNDEAESRNAEPLETAEALLMRIQQERAQRYEQQLAEWEESPSIPLLQRGKPTSTAPIPPLEKGGRGGISKPKPPKTLPPLTAEELAELPELPEGWGWVKVGNVCDCIVPNRDKPKTFSGGIPWITTPCLNESSIRVNYGDSLQGLSDSEVLSYDAKVIPVNSVVMTCIGNFGLCAVVDRPFVINQQLHAFLPSELLNPSYLAYCIQGSTGYFNKASTSTTVQYLNKEKCNSLPIPVCNFDEQVEIVKLLESKLSGVDQLNQTITTALQQAEALRQSILKKAFSGQLVPQDPNDEPASELLVRIKAERLASQGNVVVRREGKRS